MMITTCRIMWMPVRPGRVSDGDGDGGGPPVHPLATASTTTAAAPNAARATPRAAEPTRRAKSTAAALTARPGQTPGQTCRGYLRTIRRAARKPADLATSLGHKHVIDTVGFIGCQHGLHRLPRASHSPRYVRCTGEQDTGRAVRQEPAWLGTWARATRAP